MSWRDWKRGYKKTLAVFRHIYTYSKTAVHSNNSLHRIELVFFPIYELISHQSTKHLLSTYQKIGYFSGFYRAYLAAPLLRVVEAKCHA